MKLSFVIPAHNEADNISDTIDEITRMVAANETVGDYEILVIDDFSTDGTFEKVRDLKHAKVRALRLSRRNGSHVALRAGLDMAKGDAVICISADGQDNPKAINDLLHKWLQGRDIVWALRKNREEEPLRIRIFAGLFYRLLSWFGETDSHIDLSRADFYLLDRKVVDAIKSCQERNTSLFGLIVWLGFSQDYVEYDRRPRRAGRSKWNFRSRMELAKNWIIAFSGLPLKLMTPVGFAIAGVGFLYALFIIIKSLAYGSPILGWPSVFTAILVLGGGQIMMLGILGEYLWRTLDESRNRPNYFIEKDTASGQQRD